MKKTLLMIAILTVWLSACVPGSGDPDAAHQALVAFFDHLAAGEYAEAAKLYAGNYQVLAAFNPEIPPTDVVTLWQNGCEVNGLQCLPVRQALFDQRKITGVYIFQVEFANPDGSPFILEACCGDDLSQAPAKRLFEYRVLIGGGGKYQVLDLPVYVP